MGKDGRVSLTARARSEGHQFSMGTYYSLVFMSNFRNSTKSKNRSEKAILALSTKHIANNTGLL